MSLFNELKRRNVFKVAVAYVVVGWVALQIVDTVGPGLGWPDWVMSFFIVLIGLGLPIALLFAWAFELTPDGIKREGDVYRGASTTKDTGRKIDFIIIGALALAIGGLVYERTNVAPDPSAVGDTPTPLNKASIAVLAFADLSPAGDQEYFGDGIAESLLNVLAKIHELSVSSRTSSFAFKGKDRNVTDIADILGVVHVLEGSVKKAGNRVLITAQLIDAAPNRHIWSDTYERELTTENLFAIQAEIADAIVAALSEELGIGLEEAEYIDPLTANMSAYELYLQAKKATAINTMDSQYRSIALLSRAVALDPDFAQAWGSYALSLVVMPNWDQKLDHIRYQHRAIEAAERALEINPSIRVAYIALRTAYSGLHDWEKSYETIARAKPFIPTFNFGFSQYVALGYLKLAYEGGAEYFKANPDKKFTYFNLSIYFEAIGEEEKALEFVKLATLKGFTGGSGERIANLHWAMGDHAPWIGYYSREWAEKDPELLPLLPHFYNLQVGLKNNDPEAIKRFKTIAREMGITIKDLFKQGPRGGLRVPGDIAVALGGAEELAALYWSNMPKNSMWTSDLHDFRQTMAFRSRVRSSGMLAYWQKHGWPDLCRAQVNSEGEDDFVCD